MLPAKNRKAKLIQVGLRCGFRVFRFLAPTAFCVSWAAIASLSRSKVRCFVIGLFGCAFASKPLTTREWGIVQLLAGERLNRDVSDA